MKIKEFKAIVESVVGRVEHWLEDTHAIQFRTSRPVTLKLIVQLSEALGTDEINFNFGTEGEPGYSSVTPGTDGTPGYIEVKWPIQSPSKPVGPRKNPRPLLLDLEEDG